MIHPLKAVGKAMPTMFKYFSFFIIVTLCSFFSCIQFMKPSAPTDQGSAYVSTPFEEFVMSMMSFSNIDTDFSLGFNNAETNLNAQGNVVYDTDGKMSVDVDFVYNEQSFNLDVKYLTPYLYMSVTPQGSEVTTYKFDLTSQEEANGGTMDLSGLIDFIKANINFDTSTIDKFISSIGFANDNNNGQFELEDLLMKQSERRDGGYEFILGLKVADKTISVQILCDGDYNIESITLRNAAIYQTAISFGATVNNMNNDRVDVEYKETGDEVNMTGLTTFTGYAKNLFCGHIVEGDATLNLTKDEQQKTYDAKLYTDTNRFKLVTEIEGIALQLAYENEMIFLSADNLKVKFNINDYEEWRDKINYLLKEYAGKDIGEVLQDAVDKFVEKHDLGNVDLGAKILELVHGGFENVDAVNEFLPNTAQFSEDGTTYSMQWTDGTTAVLTQENEMLKNIDIESASFNFVANFDLVDETYTLDEEEYFNLSTLLPLADVVDKFVQNGQVGGTITLSYKDASFDGNYVIDFSENVVAQIHMSVLLEDVDVYVTENQIVLKLGDIVLAGSVEEIETYLQRIDAIFGTEYAQLLDSTKASDTQKIISLLSDTLKKLSIASGEESLAVISYLSVITDIDIQDDDVYLTLNYEDVNATVQLSATNEKISLPQVENNIDSLLNKIENVMTYIESGTFAFTVSGNYKEEKIDCFVQVETQDKQIKNVKLTLNDNLEIVYVDETAYIEFNSNKLQVKTGSIKEIVEIVKNIAVANGYQQQEMDYSEIFAQIFGEDVKNLTLSELLEKITLNVKGDLQKPTIGVDVNFENAASLSATVVFDKDELQGAEIDIPNGHLSLSFAQPQEISVKTNEYYNLNSKQSGSVKLSFTKGDETVDIYLNVKLDLTDKVYVKLDTILFGQQIEFVLLNDKASVKIGNIYFKANLSEAKAFYETLVQMFDLHFEEKTFDLSALAEKLNVSAAGMQARMSAQVNDNFAVAVVLSDDQTFEISQPREGEELINILPTAKKILDYVLNKQFAFEFSLNYRSINLKGTVNIDITNQIYDISGLTIGGQTLAVRYQNSYVFISLGENKFKVKVDDATAIYGIINEIIKANNLESINILEEIFGQDITKISIQEWLRKIVLSTSGDLNSIQFKGSVNTVKPASYNVELYFENECIKRLQAWIANEISVNVVVNDYSVVEIDETQFLDLTSSFSGTVDVEYTIKAENEEEQDKLVTLPFNILLDLEDKIYVNLSTTILDTKIEIVVLNDSLYVTIGDITMTQSFNNAKEMYDYIIELFEIVLEEKDGGLLDGLKKLDLNSFAIADIVDLIATNSTLHVGYKNGTLSLSANLKHDNVDAYIAPEKCEYLASFLPKIKNVVDLVNSKQYSFGFTFNYTTDGKVIEGLDKSLASFTLSGSVSIDLVAGAYAVYVDNLAGSKFAAVYKDDILYIDYLDNKIKLEKAAIEKLVPIVQELIAVNKTDTESVTFAEKLVEIFGEDLTTLSLEEIIKKFSVTLSGNTQEILVNLLFNTQKPKNANISFTFGQEGIVASWNPNTFENITEKKLVGDNLSGISFTFENYALDLNMKQFEEIAVSGDYYALSGAHSGDVVISIGFAGEEDVEYVDINAKVEIDLVDKIYLKVSGSVLDEDFEVVVLAQLNEENVEEKTVKVLYGGVYVKFGDIILTEKLDNLFGLYNQISTMFAKEDESDVLDLGALDIAQKLTSLGLTLSIKGQQQHESEIISAQISVTYTKDKISVGETEKDKIIVKAQLTNSAVTIDDKFTEDTGESLIEFMPKVKNIYSYTQNADYGFNITFAYNDGFNISGDLKLNKMSEKHEDGSVESWTEVEISNLEIFGTEAYLRIHKKDLYLAYSNTKIHVSLENDKDKDKDKQPVDIFSQLEKIMGKDFDVQLKFGVFEDLLKMITECRKSVPAYYKRLSLLASGNTDNLALSFTKDKVENNILLSANVVFAQKDALPSISANLRDIVDIGVTLLTDGTKIGDFNEGDSNKTPFSEYSSENYMDAITKSLQLYKDSSVYSFTSHMSVRYVQTLIEGDLTILLLDTNTKTAKNKEIYKPMLALSTEAMNLTVRIYLVDGIIYVDADGLLIKADVTLENVKNIIAFVNSKFMAADSQIVIEDSFLQKIVNAINSLVFDFEGEKDESGEIKFRPIMPSFDTFKGQWIGDKNEDDMGIIISTEDVLQYKEDSKFTDLVLKLLVKTDENDTILPKQVVFGANVDDPNTRSLTEEEAQKQEAKEKKYLPCEEDLTKELNFAVYLDNIFVGSDVTNISDNFTFAEQTHNVTGLRSVFDGENNVKVYNSLDAYQDYQAVLDIVSAAYDYYQTKEYKLDVQTLTIEDKLSKMKLSGDALAKAGDLKPEDKNEDEHAKDGFLDFTLEVESSLSIENFDKIEDGGQEVEKATTKHNIDIYYRSHDYNYTNTNQGAPGLYVSYLSDNYKNDPEPSEEYKQDNNIEHNVAPFRAKIENSNLSDIMAMVLNLMKLNIGDDMKETLGLTDHENTTDFSFLQALLKIKDRDESETFGKASKYLNEISEITKMVHKLTFKETVKDNVKAYVLTVEVDLLEDGSEDGEIDIYFKEVGGAMKLDSIELRHLILKGKTDDSGTVTKEEKTINATIGVKDFEACDYNTNQDHKDFSEITEIVDTLANTLNQQDVPQTDADGNDITKHSMNYHGSADVKLSGISISVPFDIDFSINANKDISLYVEMFPGPIGNDLGLGTYRKKNTGMQIDDYTGHGEYINRTSVIEYRKITEDDVKEREALVKAGEISENDLTESDIDQYRLHIKQSTVWDHKTETKYLGFYDWKRHYEEEEAYTPYVYADEWMTLQTAGDNFVTVFSKLLGLTAGISGLLERIKIDSHPSVEKLLTSFEYTGGQYKVGLNGQNLTGMEEFEPFNLDLTEGVYSNPDINPNASFKFIDKISTENFRITVKTKGLFEIQLMHIDISLNMESVTKDIIKALTDEETYKNTYVGKDGKNVDCTDHVFHTNKYYRDNYIRAWTQAHPKSTE